MTIRRQARKSPTILRMYAAATYYMCALGSMEIVTDHSKFNEIVAVHDYSLLGYRRLSKMYDLAVGLARAGVVADFVQCGVWNGGSGALLAKALGDAASRVWLFDSFEGLPAPSSLDVDFRGEVGKQGVALGSEAKVREVLARMEVGSDKVNIVKGWFDTTIPSSKRQIGKISLLHLDCDWYESVKVCLVNLYDQVTPGGLVIVDDYGCWLGCKKAVDEFLGERAPDTKIHFIDRSAIYFHAEKKAS
jgi:O-methyltransferase